MGYFPEGKEKEILKKYSKGKVVDKKDKPWLDKLQNVGLIKFGYSSEKKSLTAKTTPDAHCSNY